MCKINNDFLMNEEYKKKAQRISWDISDCFVGDINRNRDGIIVSAYLLYEMSKYNNPFDSTLEDILQNSNNIDNDILLMARKYLNEETWTNLLKLICKYSTEEFAMVVLTFETNVDDVIYGSTKTPNSIIKLSQKLLQIQQGDCVVDMGCGTGSYLISAGLEEPMAKYTGIELDCNRCTIAKMRTQLIRAEINIQCCDMFSLNENDVQYDKIFAHYPFGLKLKNIGMGASYLQHFAETYPGISKATSSDWIFNALICDLLKENGKAVAIMTNGSTWNSIDTPIRKYFVEKKMVECVISLPSRMFSMTNIPTTLIVLSHDNESVRMIDATQICQQGRRQNEFSEHDIEIIVEALNKDSKYSKKISLDELRDNDYTLSLSRYMENQATFSNAVPFESIIKSITRGAPCTASQLDEMASESVTNMQYLMLANIQNGMIDNKLPYLSFIDPKYEKYCLKNNNLILSKNGYPYKVAVATIKENQQILANGNLYIIELDESKVNPYFVKAFLESEQGIAVLKSITVGATIPNIGVDKLKKIKIPLPSMEEQIKIAQRYQETLDEIAVIKLRLEKAISKLYHIFDEESE